ncbi:hypothetical protein JMJ99_11845 [Companilactobacillus zhachilii]|uniref:hypothetical protein n=1 Tax=Companilactobacillus zhachilii TaxID=2304606 RepID=UPI001924F874|nr:hypothetical protein [Companilactobacillus zhachilii]MBL3532066.1 hypothetical protein [Companilactobacillus zhachilii]
MAIKHRCPIQNQHINNVVSVKGDAYKAFTTYKDDGQANIGTNVISGTFWKSAGIKVIHDKPFYIIGVDTMLPQSSTTLSNIVVVNYLSDYGVLAYDLNGHSIRNSNLKFKGGSEWKTTDTLINIPKIGWCYKVATNVFIPAKYQQGSGFKYD